MNTPVNPRTAARAVLAFYADSGIETLLADAPADRTAQTQTPTTESATVTPLPSAAPTAPASATPVGQEIAAQATTLEELKSAVEGWRELAIARTATRTVFADGIPSAPVMVVGEAPGAEEDRTGLPFVGEDGQLLDRILAAAGLSRRENAYLTNAVYWRPPGSRPPSPAELAACAPILARHVALAQPNILIACGKVAAQALIGGEAPLGRMRGRWHEFGGVPVRATHHPAYLLSTPEQKRAVWADMLAVMERLRGLD